MRELVSSTVKQKPIIALVDLEASRGGLTLEEVQSQLVDADAFYDKWAFNNESDAPRAKSLYEHLTAYKSIEWNRIGHFQDVVREAVIEPEALKPQAYNPRSDFARLHNHCRALRPCV